MAITAKQKREAFKTLVYAFGYGASKFKCVSMLRKNFPKVWRNLSAREKIKLINKAYKKYAYTNLVFSVEY